MSDFMLIARPGTGQTFDRLEAEIEDLKNTVTSLMPKVEWQIEFNLGRGQYVEVFSAPDAACASDVSRVAQERGLRAEVTPLRHGW